MNVDKMKKTLEYIKSIIEKSTSQKEAGEKVKSFFEYLKSMQTLTNKELQIVSDVSVDMLKNFDNIKDFDWTESFKTAQTKQKMKEFGEALLRKRIREQEANNNHPEKIEWVGHECFNPPYYKAACD